MATLSENKNNNKNNSSSNNNNTMNNCNENGGDGVTVSVAVAVTHVVDNVNVDGSTVVNTQQQKQQEDDDEHEKNQNHHDSNDENLLPKVDRRRYKKLMKRSSYQHVNGFRPTGLATSGISNIIDYQELQQFWYQMDHLQMTTTTIRTNTNTTNTTPNELLLKRQEQQNQQQNQCRPRPTIRLHWRNMNFCDNVTDGNHHRNLLFKFITAASIHTTTTTTTNSNKNKTEQSTTTTTSSQHNHKNHNSNNKNKNKKRKHKQQQQQEPSINTSTTSTNEQVVSTTSTPVPTWAAIHNPVMVHHVLVMEINVILNNDRDSNSNHSNTTTTNFTSMNKKDEKKTIVGTTTSVQDMNRHFTSIVNQVKQQQQPQQPKQQQEQKAHQQDESTALKKTHQNIHILQAATRWYHGQKVKSLSDILMYSTTNEPSKCHERITLHRRRHTSTSTTTTTKEKEKEKKGHKGVHKLNNSSGYRRFNEQVFTGIDLYQALQPFLASQQTMIDEQYPRIRRSRHQHQHHHQQDQQQHSTTDTMMAHDVMDKNTIDPTNNNSTTTTKDMGPLVPNEFPVETALQYVTKYQVEHHTNSDDDNDHTNNNNNNNNKTSDSNHKTSDGKNRNKQQKMNSGASNQKNTTTSTTTDQRSKYVMAIVDDIHLSSSSSASLQQRPLESSIPQSPVVPVHGNVYAMDCEMVRSAYGHELARITLVQLEHVTKTTSKTTTTTTVTTTELNLNDNKDHEDNADNDDDVDGENEEDDDHSNHSYDIRTKVIFDQLVKPHNPILNYVTEYSGITARMFHIDNSNNYVHLEQVQASLLTIIQPHDILIGHSLENDLRASRFIHPTVVDTSLLFRQQQQQQQQSNGSSSTTSAVPSSPSSSSSFKFSLRHLSAVLLKKQIQQPNQPHCSVIDATTAMELAIRRVLEGPTFGIAYNKPRNQLCQFLSSSSASSSTTPITTVCVGPMKWLKEHFLQRNQPQSSMHILQCESMENDSNSKALTSWLNKGKNSRKAHVVWSNFLFDATIGSTISSNSNSSDPLERKLNSFRKYLTNVIQNVPSNTVVLLAIQYDTAYAQSLSTRRKNQQQQQKQNHHHHRSTLSVLQQTSSPQQQQQQSPSSWTDMDEKEYQNVMLTNQNGLVFWITT